MEDIYNHIMHAELSLEEVCILTEEAAPTPDGCFDMIEEILLQQGRGIWARRLYRLQVDAGLERSWRDPDAFRPDPEDVKKHEKLAWDNQRYSPYKTPLERDYQPLSRARLGLLAVIYGALNDEILKDRLHEVMNKLAISPMREVPVPSLRLEH